MLDDFTCMAFFFAGSAMGGATPIIPVFTEVVASVPESAVEDGAKGVFPLGDGLVCKGALKDGLCSFFIGFCHCPDVVRGATASFEFEDANPCFNELI